MSEDGAASSRGEVAQELRRADAFVLATHENPDGDALGSLVAMQQLLTELGKDSVMFIDPSELPIPSEYSFLAMDGLVTAPPSDLDDRTIVFLDCGNIDRNPADAFKHPGAHILNLDHHHDNTRFGTVNHVVHDASCTAEIVWDLTDALGVAPTAAAADALYVGLVTDTGKFMYENTSPRAHAMAADLISRGVDVHAIYRRLYEGIPLGKLGLLARGLSKVERYDGGALTLTRVTREDYEQTGAAAHYSEGLVDYLRSVEGTAVAALIRDLLDDGKEGMRKVSLRAADDRVDVSRIARAQGGGGHRRAAGFSTDLAPDQLVRFLRDEVAAQL